jgi:type I restriction enzyme S subunit
MVPARKLVTLNYGRALKADTRSPGKVPVFGTNGQCGWHDAPLAKAPGLILGRKGQGPLGVEWCDKDFWVIDTAYYASTLTPDIDLKYLYHLVKYVGLNHLKDGTSNPTLSRDTFGAQLFPLPPLAEQKAIAAVLGALDDKIELNRRMNATLEAMARALFQSWFVDFDPVRRNKHEGRRTKDETDALFPDSFQDSELGPIPFGWEVSKLKDITSKIGSGATPRGGSEVYVDEGPALIRSQNVYDHEFHWAGLARLTDKSASELKNVEVMKDDVLLNITGDSILRTCVVDPSVLPARVNQHVAIIRAIKGIPPRYLHLYLVQDSIKSFLIGMSAGATRHAITKGHLESTDVLKPSAQVLAAFEKLTTPWFQRIDANRTQSRILDILRDTLLPKLLSGRIESV